MKNLIKILLITLFIAMTACSGSGPYKNVKDIQTAIENAMPGDTVFVANGEYKDFNFIFTGKGLADRPIVLAAETPGKVKLTGTSGVKIGGEYLTFSGFLFTNGHAPEMAVIDFKVDNQLLANHCRVTNCVVDNYNPGDRFYRDNWVQMFGKHNRVDHNTFVHKKNIGVVLSVRLVDERSQQNYHSIDHNFFGYRPRLGSNGGETIRVGVSSYSLSSSYTKIDKNMFYKCNGETEVTSIKSSDNYISNNTFFECEGSLVMRHGNRNIISGNYFLGNNKPHTGGLRLINSGHKVYNNYFYGVKGERFRSALAVMNGVPNSLLNRYFNAKDVQVFYNTFIDCDHIQFGVGSDYERTQIPENILLSKNIFVNKRQGHIYEVLDDMSGITFEKNVGIARRSFKAKGFMSIDPKLVINNNGLWVPGSDDLRFPSKGDLLKVEKDISGNPRDPKTTLGCVELENATSLKMMATMKNTGALWYNPKPELVKFSGGKVLKIKREENALPDAIAKSNPGDIIELTEAGEYFQTKTAFIKHPITIRVSAALKTKPVFIYKGDKSGFTFISIENGGSLNISGLAFDGDVENTEMPSMAIRTSQNPMIEHYRLFVENCDFTGFQYSRNNAFRAFKSTYADTIIFENCYFSKISGDAISLAGEREDKGIYNAEYVFLLNNIFDNVMGAALNFYRGGNDESTFGPFLTVDHCVFYNVNNKEQGSVLLLIGVQNADIKNSNFVGSGRGGRSIKFEESRWNHIKIHHCNIDNSGKVETFYPNSIGARMTRIKTRFSNPEKRDFRLMRGSPLLKKGSDNRSVGLLQ